MITMTKRRLLRWSLILVVLAAFAVWLEPTRVVWGWLRGEAFYQGRPTSWWERELAQWYMFEFDSDFGHRAHKMVIFQRSEETAFDWLRARVMNESPRKINVNDVLSNWGALSNVKGPSLVHGDPHSESVLRVLELHPEDRIRDMAKLGLQMITAMQVRNEMR